MALRKYSAIWRAVPSAVFSAMLPENPSVTITSAAPLPMPSPSTKPMKSSSGRFMDRNSSAASLTSSTPFTSSTPILSRPTVGRSMSNSTRAIAPPMIASDARWRASPPIEAPTSSTTDCRPHAGDCRTVNAGQHPQVEARHRHQRTGVPGGHGHIGLAFFYRIKCEPHRGGLAATAQRLTRLLLHGDGDIGVDHLRGRLHGRMLIELPVDRGAVAEQDEFRVGVPRQRDSCTRNHHGGTEIAAHGIERNTNLLGHGRCQNLLVQQARWVFVGSGNELRLANA